MLTKIELAKTKIAMHCSFMISLTSKLKFKEATNLPIPTASTDGRHVFYSLEYVDSLPLGQVIGLICHEVGHNMYAHMSGLRGRDPQIANLAWDIVLNKRLLKFFAEFPQLKAELPPTELVGPQWDKYDDSWNWERVYDDLLKEQKQQKQGKGSRQGLPKQFDTVLPPVDAQGNAMKPEEVEALAKEWIMAAQQAATMAKTRGTMPGMFEELITDMITPKIDWRSQLWDVFTRTAKDDQSWQRFNRRYMHTNMYLPGMYSERLGLVAFAVDTSGSMSSQEFKVAMGAINEVMEDLKPERIMFIQCDTRINSAEELKPDDLPLVAVGFKGRGGTTLTPIFEYIKKMDEEPELVVCLTDGEHEVISRELCPPCSMTWLVTTRSTSAAENSFGRVIRVEV